MRRIVLLSIFAAACVAPAFAETHLSGDIKAAALDSSGNPYIVDQDVVVPAGKKLVLKEGCVFLFKGFTGLNVAGQLHVAGTAKRPVVFTSVNDGDFNPKSDQLPNPFDWNGILVAKESAGALLENFNLRYSVYGVKSQTTNVSVQNGVFRQNGQFHFTINEKIQYVQDNIPFTYTGTAADVEKPSASVSGENGATAPKKTGKPGHATLVFRYTSLCVGVVGVAAGSVMLIPWSSAKKELSLSQSDFYQKYGPDPTPKWNEFNADLNGWGTGSIISYTLGLLGLVGFGISFAF
ncbi:MAG TPA: hypothetical protein VKF42_10800 [Chitinivibrionales bacterium]|jgi:hypothetical protein|nr:hypothetical protein [Chitinivibrionales bacterium]